MPALQADACLSGRAVQTRLQQPLRTLLENKGPGNAEAMVQTCCAHKVLCVCPPCGAGRPWAHSIGTACPGPALLASRARDQNEIKSESRNSAIYVISFNKQWPVALFYSPTKTQL